MRLDTRPRLVFPQGPSPSSTVVRNDGPNACTYAITEPGAAIGTSLASGALVTLTTPMWFVVAVGASANITISDVSSTVSNSEVLLPAADVAAINTVLAANAGKTVRGRPGSNYQINAPIVVPSNTTLDMTGCTITLLAECNMLQNAAVAPAVTATDVATTNASGTITSATLAASAVVGQDLAVVGASTATGGIGWMYGKVATVDTGTGVITLSGNEYGIHSTQTLTNATGYLFNRDSNITVIGGTWDGGTIWNTLGVRTAAGMNSNQLRFTRVDGLNVRGCTMKLTSFPLGGGYVFGVTPSDCTDFIIEDITGVGSSTCVQGQGPLNRGTIRNIYGQTQDDQVALGTVNAATSQETEGDIRDVVIENVVANGSLTAVKLFGGQSSTLNYRPMSGITIRGIKGWVTTIPVTVINYGGSAQVDALIEDITCLSGGSTQPMVNIQAVRGQTFTVRNVKWASTAPVATAGVINVTGAQNCTIDGLDIRGTSGTYVGVNYGAASQSLTIKNVTIPDAGVTCTLVKLTAATTLDRLSISDVQKAGPGNLVDNLGMTTLGSVTFTAGRQTSGQLYTSATSTVATTLRVTNWYGGTNAQSFTIKHPATLLVASSEFVSSTGLVLVSTANATPVAIVVSSAKLSGASVVLATRDGSQAISVNSPNVGQVDQSILTPADGDQVYNSNATPTNGVGVAIYNTAATKWKNVYSGVTS